jgi:hypothetical protein
MRKPAISSDEENYSSDGEDGVSDEEVRNGYFSNQFHMLASACIPTRISFAAL